MIFLLISKTFLLDDLITLLLLNFELNQNNYSYFKKNCDNNLLVT